MRMTLTEIQTPALVISATDLEFNLKTMAKALPGARLRPHVKAHKCTALARLQSKIGHHHFTCATIREVEGLVAAGLDKDILLANEVLDARRLGRLNAGITLAVDSRETIRAAVRGGVKDVLIDVNVGLNRCGCIPDIAGRLADVARRQKLNVRGVMGYEGHAMHEENRSRRKKWVSIAMDQLIQAWGDVGGELISGGGTGTFDCNRWVNEIQAGSYVLMDTSYAKMDLPFRKAFYILATVLSVGHGYAVADCGLKALGMDSGYPTVENAKVKVVTDEHITLIPRKHKIRIGDRIKVWPAHIDPTIAYHSHLWVEKDHQLVDRWDVDLRGW